MTNRTVDMGGAPQGSPGTVSQRAPDPARLVTALERACRLQFQADIDRCHAELVKMLGKGHRAAFQLEKLRAAALISRDALFAHAAALPPGPTRSVAATEAQRLKDALDAYALR